ncbi:hypothetical protein RDI58_015480 [Solanum bulbocastanum]|uniref:Uncharacterized protein n=1 Tax=Solanum bulbocastanum TaxID=147425 RepID=A0AAN8YBH0_SOLBU
MTAPVSILATPRTSTTESQLYTTVSSGVVVEMQHDRGNSSIATCYDATLYVVLPTQISTEGASFEATSASATTATLIMRGKLIKLSLQHKQQNID